MMFIFLCFLIWAIGSLIVHHFIVTYGGSSWPHPWREAFLWPVYLFLFLVAIILGKILDVLLLKNK